MSGYKGVKRWYNKVSIIITILATNKVINYVY